MFGRQALEITVTASGRLKKLYLTDRIVFDEITLSECTALEYVIILPIADYNDEFNEFLPSVGNDHNIYVFLDIYFERYKDNWSNSIFPAHVTYYYNFERPDNGGVFWLDIVEQRKNIVDQLQSDPSGTDTLSVDNSFGLGIAANIFVGSGAISTRRNSAQSPKAYAYFNCYSY